MTVSAPGISKANADYDLLKVPIHKKGIGFGSQSWIPFSQRVQVAIQSRCLFSVAQTVRNLGKS